MANGPFINNMSVDARRASAAVEAVRQAERWTQSGTPVEQAFVRAVAKRFPAENIVDRRPSDVAYADAMREMWRAFPGDDDVGALTAEAILDLRPWDQWTLEGRPQPGTEEVTEVLERVLAKNPNHPFGLHLLIHAVEASPFPDRAARAADSLRQMTPGIDHLLHMPSHIDVRRGHWEAAIIANENAIAADSAFRKQITHNAPYDGQLGHNYHMLSYAASMSGQSEKATRALGGMFAEIPRDIIALEPERCDGYFAMPYELHLRFGRWDAMLSEPPPKPVFAIATALWHYARGIAFAAKKQIGDAKNERLAFLGACSRVPPTSRFRSVLAMTLLKVAGEMLLGEILYRDGQSESSITSLRQAVRDEDQLPYTEPPSWIVPVRHSLGATLLDANHYADAEAVYREDLLRHPENGWALYGLAHSLQMQGKVAESKVAMARFREAWKDADFQISSSCCCLPGHAGQALK